MIAVFVILVFVLYLTFFFPMEAKEKKVEEKSPKYTAQMKKLWQVAQTSMKEHKPSRAEKALLTILKFDEKNAAAYNRLGILYAREKKFDEAVECFEIAQSLDNNPASIHNVGLIYLETGAYEKAVMAFRQAIAAEGDVPARYIALAKAEEKMGSKKRAIEALENAFELDPKVSTLRQILAIYEEMGDSEAVTVTAARVEEQIIKDNEAKKKRAEKRAVKSMRGRTVRKTTSVPARGATRTRVAGKSASADGGVGVSARAGTKVRAGGDARASVGKAGAPSKVIKTHTGRKRI